MQPKQWALFCRLFAGFALLRWIFEKVRRFCFLKKGHDGRSIRAFHERKDEVGWSAEISLVFPVKRGSTCGSRSFCVVALAETRDPPPVWSTDRGHTDTGTQQGSSWKGSARLQSWSSGSQEDRSFWSSSTAFFLRFFLSSWLQNKNIGEYTLACQQIFNF